MKKPSPPFLPSARQVRAIRGWMGVSQGEFARMAGVSVSAVADFEIGKRATKPETRSALATAVKALRDVAFSGNQLRLPE